MLGWVGVSNDTASISAFSNRVWQSRNSFQQIGCEISVETPHYYYISVNWSTVEDLLPSAAGIRLVFHNNHYFGSNVSWA